MKQSTVQIRYDAEKLRVLRQYIKDETELQAGLESLLQSLYETYVPAEVRETIDGRN
ncbi:DUF6103 family protein [Pelotomaculum terephthalicicum JT]|jgi:hypothetical protein|uniref:DUF6103 family protein n=1 Tax=Pelotomaculum terephthalicicum TaxID=206393 RepID=UPI001F04DEC9|nr:DUF6103 family protein [Pelotomaculum terephthalicicum]MCG9967470.1 DUF6103 family protein [Pelotomaculum terephthalicicum JT]